MGDEFGAIPGRAAGHAATTRCYRSAKMTWPRQQNIERKIIAFIPAGRFTREK